MAFYNHLSAAVSEDSTGGVSVRRQSRCPLRVSDSVQSKKEVPANRQRCASVKDLQKGVSHYNSRTASRHRLADSAAPRFKFTTSDIDGVLQELGSYFAFVRRSDVPGADLTLTYQIPVQLDLEAADSCDCHPRLAVVLSSLQSAPDDVVSIQFQLLSVDGASKEVLMENTRTEAADAGAVLSLHHIKDAILSFVNPTYQSMDEVKSAFADTFMGDVSTVSASHEVTDASDAEASEKPISKGDVVYAASPKLDSMLQGVPLKVVAVNERINMVIVQLPNGQSKGIPLSLVKR